MNITAQLSTTKVPTSIKVSPFQKQLKYYNLQEEVNKESIRKLIIQINNECKPTEKLSRENCFATYFELQTKYDNQRKLKNLKRRLFSRYNFYWDEEFF